MPLPAGPISAGGGGAGLSFESLETLKHIVYNPVNNRMEVDVSLSSTLETFYFAEQGSLSAAGSTFVFSNTDTGLDSFPISIHYKDQFIEGNDGEDGYVYPYVPEPSDLLSIDVFGVEDPTNVTIYESSSLVETEQLVFGIEFVFEQEISATDFIFYGIRLTDEEGSKIFSQTKTGLTFSVGDKYLWEFNHPVLLAPGNIFHNHLSFADARDGVEFPLAVRSSIEDANIPYINVKVRAITRQKIATVNSINLQQGEFETFYSLASLVDAIHFPDGQIILWEDDEFIQWELP